MGQRVKEMVSEEIIDETTVRQEVAEAKEEIVKAEASQEEKTEKKVAKKKITAKKRGKKYLDAQTKIDKNKVYSTQEAIEKIIETSVAKFDATVEIHAFLSVGNIRGMIVLPAGAPKEKKVFEISEKNIDEFLTKVKSNKIDFDLIIATPSVMPKLAGVAKILGPRGLMPSPKSGTVVEDTKVAAEEIRSGKVEYKQDGEKNIHLAIAKISFGPEKIRQNLEAFLKVLPKNKVLSAYLTSTMGPSVQIEIPK
ncbi:MAG: 50S ribosomal protein L1 [Candidatus Berkelbacteria bacterium]|nr:50S ribosomal protein L1 [Candidatus Berkelbacteria bacterium]